MRFPQRKYSLPAMALLGVIVLCIGWAGSGLFSHTPRQALILGPAAERGEQTEAPAAEETVPPTEEETAQAGEKNRDAGKEGEADFFVIEESVQPGDTAGKILLPFLSSAEIQAVSDACDDLFPLRRLRQGNPYTLTVADGKFVSFIYEIDSEQKLIVGRDGGNFTASLEKIQYQVEVKKVRGVIGAHLFQAVADAGEGPTLAVAMADIFAWEINFIRDLHPGDSFTVLVEKRFRDGEFKGYGRILGAVFINQGVAYEAFCFRDAEGFPHYYTSKGESVKRAFLKAPLSFTRISSTFSPKRLHPILNVWRAHPGIDYAAPTGTPVKAVAAGTVTFRGWGKGAGNYIALRHSNNFETMYMHLSGFAKGLEVNKKVRQGEVVGFVGSTGYATGPHLDFRMKKDGQYVNPLKLVSPRTEPVTSRDLPEFRKLVDEMREKLGQT
ncbi:MAG: peptidoglycan DD-metalloendopeptidase family protein [Deltaproteobacteria bacterium]|jgi:murein DD-endopeptidase MepM/ murein hydrolase activator NlpD|nr:peptidoglycan DD-metalloendopeptidase family protein [Deltaproteobacteria bacterium]